VSRHCCPCVPQPLPVAPLLAARWWPRRGDSRRPAADRADSPQRALPRPCLVRCRGSAARAGAEEQIVPAEIARVEPATQHENELGRYRHRPWPGLWLTWLVEGDVGLSHLDGPPTGRRKVHAARSQHHHLGRAKPGVVRDRGHCLIHPARRLVGHDRGERLGHGRRIRQGAYVDGLARAHRLAPRASLGRRWPGISRQHVELHSSSDAGSRDLPVARRSPRGERLAVVTDAQLLVDDGQAGPVELSEAEAPAPKPPFGRVPRPNIRTRTECGAQVRSKGGRCCRGVVGRDERNESSECLDRRVPGPRLPLCPLLGEPAARPDLDREVTSRRSPGHWYARLVVEAIADAVPGGGQTGSARLRPWYGRPWTVAGHRPTSGRPTGASPRRATVDPGRRTP
jgi:hypothetical protein